jgi:hypothetical protein
MFEDKTQWAWAAGLFEGEGSLFANDHQRRLSIGSTDQDVIESFHSVVGVGRLVGPYAPRNDIGKKVQYRWQTYRWPEIILVTDRFFPFLSTRRRTQVQHMLDHAPKDWRRDG